MTRSNLCKGLLVSFALFLSITIISDTGNASFIVPSPLVYRVMKANFVVVGRLTDVKKQATYVHHTDSYMTGKSARFYLDTGTILSDKVLFPINPRRQNQPQQTQKFPFASYSGSHPQGNGNFMRSSAHFHFDEGDEGIWILEKAVFADHFTVVHPANLLPIDSLKAVENAVAKVSRFIAEQRNQ